MHRYKQQQPKSVRAPVRLTNKPECCRGLGRRHGSWKDGDAFVLRMMSVSRCFTHSGEETGRLRKADPSPENWMHV